MPTKEPKAASCTFGKCRKGFEGQKRFQKCRKGFKNAGKVLGKVLKLWERFYRREKVGKVSKFQERLYNANFKAGNGEERKRKGKLSVPYNRWLSIKFYINLIIYPDKKQEYLQENALFSNISPFYFQKLAKSVHQSSKRPSNFLRHFLNFSNPRFSSI